MPEFVISPEQLRCSVILDFEGEGRKKGDEISPLPHMAGIFRPNSRGKSGKYEWIAFKKSWKPATNGSRGQGNVGSVTDFNDCFDRLDTSLLGKSGKLVHWSQHEADILNAHLSTKIWTKLRPLLFNARLPAKKYARRRKIFENSGETKGKSLEEFFDALYRKRHPFPPLPRGAAATCRLIDKACDSNRRWKGFSEAQKNYVSELIEYNRGDCRATWLIASKMANVYKRADG